jgi:hypothetical protein
MLGFGSGIISLDTSTMNILAKASVEREVRAIVFLNSQNSVSDKKFILIGQCYGYLEIISRNYL